jgi:uncharacterized protein YfkK (UPF0435 family)
MRKSTIERMLQLANIKPVVKEGKITVSNFELTKNSVDGNTYAIVRENKKYHIKQAQTKENLTESDFDYVGGVANKMKKSFNSFSDATKHLNLMFEEINNHYDVDTINLLESDNILLEKKFVLKLGGKKNKPKKEEPSIEEPAVEKNTEGGDIAGFDFGGEESPKEDEGGLNLGFGDDEESTEDSEDDLGFGNDEESTEDSEDDLGFGNDEESTEDSDLEDSDDEIKDIQSTTGKLGQQLRDVEDISSDMMKWVAKSVLSALDLDNMDSEDKKDIIRTVKKKSEEESEEDVESEEEDFNFGDEEEKVEESYDSYMDDSDPFDGMDKYLSPKQERRKRYFDKEDIESEWGSEEEDVSHEFPSKELNEMEDEEFMRGADRNWREKEEDYGTMRGRYFDNEEVEEWSDDDEKMERLEVLIGEARDFLENECGYDLHDINLMSEDDIAETLFDEGNIELAKEIDNLLDYFGGFDWELEKPYDSYMSGGFNEKAFESWMEEMEDMGIVAKSYDSYMDDDMDKYKDPKIAEPTDKNVKDKLLFDSEDNSEMLYGPNSTRRYDRSEMTRARRQADKDMSSHYYKFGTPGYEEKPSEDWAKHRLPYDTKFDFMSETDYMNEDHLNVEMETYEQERAYEDIEKVVRRYGMDVELRKKETSEDPEESLIYLDIIEGNKKLLVARINSVGDIEVGEMNGSKFVGEPIDSVEDFIEIFGEDLTSKEKDSLDMFKDTEMNQPKRSPKEQPGQPATKPGKPERKNPSERPSRRPFSPPPGIEPGEETDPKAGKRRRSYMSDDPTMAPSPAPSKPTPSKEPGTKPGKPERKNPSERPSRRPFSPPPGIEPGEETDPKAGYNKDVEFE